MSNVIKSKRFVVRKSLIGKNQVIEFTNKKGDTVKYNHDKVFSIMKSCLEKLASISALTFLAILTLIVTFVN